MTITRQWSLWCICCARCFIAPKKKRYVSCSAFIKMALGCAGFPFSAADVLNDSPREKLTRIFKEYGEIRNAGRLSDLVMAERSTDRLRSAEQLKALASNCAIGKLNKYLAQVFQALRIEVNQELDALKQLLVQSVEVMEKGSRLVVISYHSLEDRLVKNFIRAGNFNGDVEKDFYGNMLRPFKAVNNKVIVPSPDEIIRNNRARSAKLRVAERL